MFSTRECISRAKSESCIESANHHRHNTKKKKFTIRALSRIQSSQTITLLSPGCYAYSNKSQSLSPENKYHGNTFHSSPHSFTKVSSCQCLRIFYKHSFGICAVIWIIFNCYNEACPFKYSSILTENDTSKHMDRIELPIQSSAWRTTMKR